MISTLVLATLTILSLGLALWQLAVALRFPLHRRSSIPEFHPSISILKPLKGCDAKTEECLRTWLTQDYGGELEVLFGISSADDPVRAVVQRLMAEHPECPAQLVVCPQGLGPNLKVSTLIQLERIAQHGVICVSDADVYVPPDFLSNAVAPLRDRAIGLVNCFYRLAPGHSFAMRWEAFAVNADFWSQVLQSLALKPMDFALGAAMLMPRERLKAIGGFASLVDHLADDYQLGNRIARKGGRIALCPIVVECRSAPMALAEVWAHQLRWARTIRVCQPVPYFFSILSNASLWPLLWLGLQPGPLALLAGAFCLAFRMASGFLLERRLTGNATMSSCWMAVVKDLLQVALWALAFTGRQVTWRGERFQVKDGGRLLRTPARVRSRRISNATAPAKGKAREERVSLVE